MKVHTRSLGLLAGIAALGLAAAAPAAEIVRHTNPAPAIILQAVTVPPGAETLILSGQLPSPIDPAKTEITSIDDLGDTKTQTISTLTKIKAILESRGYAMSDVIKMTSFLTADPKLGGKMDFKGYNEGFKLFFGTTENPNTVTRSTVQVAGLAGPYFLVELEVTAAKMPNKK